jgi:hypothetical protein
VIQAASRNAEDQRVCFEIALSPAGLAAPGGGILGSVQVTREVACRGLIGAIYKDAFEIASQIICELRDKGVEPSLDDPACRDVFALDWFIARLAYLYVLAGDIRDGSLKEQFRREIETSIEDVSEVVYDAKPEFAQYRMLAMNYLEGVRDSFGLLPGPGPFLSSRYELHVEHIRTGGHSDQENLQTTETESILISLLGDGVCWTLNGTLDEVLSSMVQM